MYAHSSFVRNKPELLSDLRKCTSASRSKTSHSASSSNSCSSCDESDSGSSNTFNRETSSTTSSTTTESSSPLVPPRTVVQASGSSYQLNQSWSSVHRSQPTLIPKAACLPSIHHSIIGRKGGIGMLDLLALAVEHAA
jgi:hypothetical protein